MDELSRLIGQIYDTVTDPALWPKVLGEICAFTDCTRTTLILEDADEPRNTLFYLSYTDDEFIRRYVERYLPINPMRLATGSSARTGDVILTGDFMTPQEYGRTRFARDFLLAYQIVDIAAAILERTATSITVLSLKRSREQGFADEEVRRKLHLLAPHVRRAVAIGRAFEQKTMAATALANTIDALAGAVFLLDAAGGVLHASTGALALLARKTVVRLVGTTLVAQKADAQGALMEALAAAGGGDAALGTRGTSIIFAKGADGMLLGTIMPLTEGARRRAAFRSQAVAALCIRETSFEAPSDISALERSYDLTQREATVLRTIVEVAASLKRRRSSACPPAR